MPYTLPSANPSDQTSVSDDLNALYGELDLTKPYWQKTISDRIKVKIDQYSIDGADDGFRTHLGWSVIEHECLRYLYYHWRWFWKEEHHARMERIFIEGHKIEAEFRVILKALGAKFLDKVDETGEQLKVSELEGHAGGSCDGVFVWPEIGLNEPIILEAKSSKTGSPFNDLAKKSLSVAKPRHYIQACGYGKGLGIRYALYVCRNKNDSSIYIELVELDWEQANQAIKKAQYVMTLIDVPKRISEKRNFHICNMCSIQPLCHDRKDPVPNCRNCKNAAPVQNAQWFCSHWQQIIPKESIVNGCPQHEFLPW